MREKGKNRQLAIFMKSKFIRNSNEFNRLYTYRAQKRTHTCKSQYKLHSHKKNSFKLHSYMQKLVQTALTHLLNNFKSLKSHKFPNKKVRNHKKPNTFKLWLQSTVSLNINENVPRNFPYFIQSFIILTASVTLTFPRKMGEKLLIKTTFRTKHTKSKSAIKHIYSCILFFLQPKKVFRKKNYCFVVRFYIFACYMTCLHTDWPFSTSTELF